MDAFAIQGCSNLRNSELAQILFVWKICNTGTSDEHGRTRAWWLMQRIFWGMDPSGFRQLGMMTHHGQAHAPPLHITDTTQSWRQPQQPQREHTKRGCSWWVSKGSSGNWAIGKGAGFNQGNASSWTIPAHKSWLLEWVLFSVTPWGEVVLVSSSSYSETLHTQQLCHSWTLKPFTSDVNLAPCSF